MGKLKTEDIQIMEDNLFKITTPNIYIMSDEKLEQDIR